jgi:hypothetical protein
MGNAAMGNWTSQHSGVEHPGQLQVHGKDCAASDFLEGIQARWRSAD